MIGKVNRFLSQKLKKTEDESSSVALISQSARGNLTSFSGIFGVAELNQTEKNCIQKILLDHLQEGLSIDEDLQSLITVTSEVKAINNQAIILHGERIKKAHAILTQYRDGAFTAWLIATYGNRQTPYNFLQYYQFYTSMPPQLRPLIESMPKQAIYTLASREGNEEAKQKVIEKYQGETKREILSKIREQFPLQANDKRNPKHGRILVKNFQTYLEELKKQKDSLSENEIAEITLLNREILQLLS